MLVWVNVGGTEFFTSLKTLNAMRNFEMKACVTSQKNSDDYLFVDRDPESFRVILNWVRGYGWKCLPFRNHVLMAQVKEDALWYGVDSLFKYLATRIDVSDKVGTPDKVGLTDKIRSSDKIGFSETVREVNLSCENIQSCNHENNNDVDEWRETKVVDVSEQPTVVIREQTDAMSQPPVNLCTGQQSQKTCPSQQNNSSEDPKNMRRLKSFSKDSGYKGFCPYHNTFHGPDPNEKHEGCKTHGHCLFPIQCPTFGTCPMHIGGKNLFLAWSYRRQT